MKGGGLGRVESSGEFGQRVTTLPPTPSHRREGEFYTRYSTRAPATGAAGANGRRGSRGNPASGAISYFQRLALFYGGGGSRLYKIRVGLS